MLNNRESLKILLVEDDPNDAFIIDRLLRHSRYFECDLTICEAADQALQQLTGQSFDLIILDFWLKSKDSLGLIAKYNAQHTTPTIVISSMDMTDVQAKSLDAGALAYLHKNDLTAGALDSTFRTLLFLHQRDYQLRSSLDEKVKQEVQTRNSATKMAEKLLYTLNDVHNIAEKLDETRRTPTSDPQMDKYPNLIKQSSRQLLKLLQAYLATTKQEQFLTQLTYQRICLIDLVENAAKATAQNTVAKHQEVDIVTTCEQLLIDVDAIAMFQIFIKLINNASKFSQIGAPIRLSLEDLNDKISVAIIDHGIGMSEDEIAGIRVGFYKSLSSQQSLSLTELTLPNVQAILERHGGAMEIDSFKNWGTTIRITLPRRRPTLN